MNKMKKLLALLAAAVMLLTACGGGKAPQRDPGGSAGENTGTGDGAGSQEQTVQGDTWGAENGMSGYVEYKYDDEGREIERILINGVTGTLYRRFETTYGFDNVGDGDVPVSLTSTYGPNNILLYTLDMYYSDDGYLTWSSGYDVFLQELTMTQTYSGKEQLYATDRNIYDFRSEVLVFWIDHYGPEGLESRDYYWKDGTPYAQEFFGRDSEGNEVMAHAPLRGASRRYSPEYNDQGQLIAYRWIPADEGTDGYIKWAYEYDAAGRMTRKTEYDSDGDIERDKKLTYAEDGSLTQCSVLCAHEWFHFNYENGVLVSRNGINNEVGAMMYDYHPSGVVRTLIGADSYDFTSNFHWFYRFAEDGSLLAKGTYDYNIRESVWYDIRMVEFYNPDGTLDRKYEWTEDSENNEGIFRTRQYLYDEAGNETTNYNEEPYEEPYHDPIPAEDEVGFILDFLNSH